MTVTPTIHEGTLIVECVDCVVCGKNLHELDNYELTHTYLVLDNTRKASVGTPGTGRDLTFAALGPVHLRPREGRVLCASACDAGLSEAIE